MLALPFQRGISSPGMASSLRSFIDSQYDDDSENKFNPDITNYVQVREAALASIETATASSVQHLLRAHKLMEAVVPRLAGYESELRLSFTWFDAFKPTKKAVNNSMYFDWGCFLWNYAALECQIGSRVDRSSEEGIREANKHFQTAASALEYIIENLYPQIRGESVSGLTDEGLRMAMQLMLAQAQLCFYEKAVKDRKAGNMKAGVIAKLAAQTAVYYEAASRLCKIGAVASYVDPSWAAHTEFQRMCFEGATEYWQSQSAKEVALQKGSGYAEEIPRLIRAESSLRKALIVASKGKLGLSLTGGAEALLRTITSARVSAENDNRTVYMEPIPHESSLANVAPVSMVKSTAAVPDLPGYQASDHPVFQALLPKAVRKISAEGRDNMNGILSKATTVASEATNNARASLSAAGLPGSLESYKSGGELPENLWLKIQRVQALGGLRELQSKFDALGNAAQRAILSMSSIDESLMREEQTDDSFRIRFPDCDSAPSAHINADIKANNRRMREAYDNARASDANLERELSDPTFIAVLGVLSKSKEEVSQLLPKPQAPLIDFADFGAPSIGGSNSLVDTSTLERKLLEMAALIEERDAILTELKNIAAKDISEQLAAVLAASPSNSTFSSSAAAEGDSVLEQAAREAMTSIAATAEERARAIDASVDRQHSLLREIATANDTFIRDRQNDPATLERDRIIKQLEQGISRFFAAHSQLVAGATFYSNLQSRLTTILQSSDDLSYTQTLMRQEFESRKAEEFERREQELRDMEYALQVKAEMEALASNASAASGQPAASAFVGASPPAAFPSTYTLPAADLNPPPAYGRAQPQIQSMPMSQYPGMQAAPLSQYPGLQASPGPQYPGINAALPQSSNEVQLQQQILQLQQQLQQQQQQQQRPPPYGATAPTAPPQSAYNPAYNAASTGSTAQPPPPPAYNDIVYGQVLPNSRPIAAAAATAPTSFPQQQPSAHPLQAKANRLVEMGFPLEKAFHALQVNDGDEEAALNSLLSS